jgi:hypothetical protein
MRCLDQKPTSMRMTGTGSFCMMDLPIADLNAFIRRAPFYLDENADRRQAVCRKSKKNTISSSSAGTGFGCPGYVRIDTAFRMI